MKFILATKNLKNLKELERILKPLGHEVLCERNLEKPLPEVVEDADSFEGNALLKAHSAMKITGLAAVADDSGLCVDFLDGAPGVYSARYAGEEQNDQKNNEKLLNALKGLPNEKRTARYVSAVAVVFPDGREFTVRGTCEGYIADHEEGSNGFGYDTLFVGELGCFGLLSDEQKDSISHRGRALNKMVKELEKYI
ncbi:MAG: RdgB/HAM1 family non-canonical purine NTP pyrophosphatase [Clostridia bacterium]|nr:RdgB/HAM1 family non-canonical purine NTP pyrophosphatase [Clostridia bacterium]